MPFDLAADGDSYQVALPELIYGRVIATPTKGMPPVGELVRALNDCLRDDIHSDWQCEEEIGEASTPAVTPLLLRPPRELRPEEPARSASDVLVLLRRTGGSKLTADLIAFGDPAGKPSAITLGEFGRVPAAVISAGRPPARPVEELPGGRRPVVAILDTAVAEHPYLGPSGTDGFWLDATDRGWRPGPVRPRVTDPHDKPKSWALGSHFGHGTFTTGLIRQAAPDAHVLSVQVMDDEGVVYVDRLLNALGWLYEQITEHGLVIDLVCVPIGFTVDLPEDGTLIRWLGKLLAALGELGVRVVASAGNDGTDAPSYPAAFTLADHHPRTGLISIGALNPNGITRAYYSNYGRYVTHMEVGTSVVSTFPMVNGRANPELGPTDDRRPAESIDPDDYRGGWARWSGTSFAAAVFAGRLANALAHLPEGVPTDPTPQSAHERAERALATVDEHARRP